MPTFGLFLKKILTINYYYYFLLWPRHEACGHLVSWWGVKVLSSALEVWSLNHWTAKEFPVYVFSCHLSARRAKDKNIDLNTSFTIVLVSLGCSNNTRDWLAYKQQKFTSYCSGGWKFEIRVPAWSASDESGLSGLQRATFMRHPSMVERARGSRVSFVLAVV